MSPRLNTSNTNPCFYKISIFRVVLAFSGRMWGVCDGIIRVVYRQDVRHDRFSWSSGENQLAPACLQKVNSTLGLYHSQKVQTFPSWLRTYQQRGSGRGTGDRGQGTRHFLENSKGSGTLLNFLYIFLYIYLFIYLFFTPKIKISPLTNPRTVKSLVLTPLLTFESVISVTI